MVEQSNFLRSSLQEFKVMRRMERKNIRFIFIHSQKSKDRALSFSRGNNKFRIENRPRSHNPYKIYPRRKIVQVNCIKAGMHSFLNTTFSIKGINGKRGILHSHRHVNAKHT